MLTLYNPHETTIKQINHNCLKADGQLRLFFQIAPTYKTLLGESEEMKMIGRVYDNGLLIFDSSSLACRTLGQDGSFAQHFAPLDQGEQILHKNANDSAIVHNKSLIYFIECKDYLSFLEEILKLQLLTKYRDFKYFQDLEEQINEELELVILSMKEFKESGTVSHYL